jgi:nucleotide-binding universal stress UspA family protein
MSASGPLLLCFDGSEEAADAIRTAGRLLAGREALVLTVAVPARHELPLDPLGDLAGRLSGLYREWDDAAAEVADREARRGCEIAVDAGLDARPLIACDKAAVAILRVAQEHDASAIVLGAGRHGAIEGLLGSVSARVAHRADRPVLVIPGR